MQPAFPFSAIVGQDALKRALLLGVIQPSLGGVLVRGTKGVAKSTAVRALAALLPPIETVAGCPVQRRPGEMIDAFPLPPDAPTLVRPVPLVELPLGATEDRVLGSLHLEKALRGERAFDPGLLAAANRGILYIDEVNLLPDHLVDVLLDAAASGVHRVEREGLSLSHPARFLLVGTMNPEEGELRPQLLDRFGLAVDVLDLTDPADRAEAVRRRLAFEADPAAFAALWKPAEDAESERVARAQQLLPRVSVPNPLLRALSERCLAAGVEGLRADLTLCKAACAWAAYQGRTAVEDSDLDAVAELALAHRRTRPPQPPPGGGDNMREPGSGKGSDAQRKADQTAVGDRASASFLSSTLTFPSDGLFAARPRPKEQALARSTVPGRWDSGAAPRRGRCGGALQPYRGGAAVSWAATLRAAAPYQAERGNGGGTGQMVLRGDDLRAWPRRGPAGCLLLFVVDASGSMAAWQRMRQTKAAVLALLVRAYQCRDRVALLAFRGGGAELVLPPARGLRTARRALEELPVGGTTPLAHGLAAACRLVRGQQRRQPDQPVWTVVLTDGRANVPLSSADSWRDALGQARALAACGTDCLLVDTQTGWPRLGRTQQLARALAASYLALQDVLGRPLPDPGRRAV
jgi:magnesium chelatase subunit D